MAYNIPHIEALLQKYWEGETSLNEEAMLREFFTSGIVPDHLKPYQVVFTYFVEQSKPGLSENFEAKLARSLEQEEKSSNLKVASKRSWMPMLRVAASVALLLGVFFLAKNFSSQTDSSTAFKETYESPEEAYEKIEEALLFVSVQLNKGKKQAADNIRRVKEATRID